LSKVRSVLWIPLLIAGGLLVFAGAAAAQSGQLVSADYGAGNNRVDVTSRVQSLAQDGSLNFRVSDDALGGDPAPHQAKELRIRLRGRDGRIQDYRFQERDTVDLTLAASGDDRDRDGERNLRIIRARYGSGDRWSDVTAILQDQVRDGRLSLKVNNTNMGGDPAEERRKELRLEWEYRGQRQESLFLEGDFIDLPGDAADHDRDYDRSSQGLRIIRARWGGGNRWLDVTATLQSLVNNDRLDAKVNNTNMGADPAEDQHKELEVEWEYRGRRQESRLREGDYLHLPGTDADGDRDHDRNSRDLRIISALYGAGDRWIDITGTLQNLVADNRLNVKVNNTNLGADPAVGLHKELQLTWEYQGQRHESRLREGDYINIP
jgi:hypothetical protein